MVNEEQNDWDKYIESVLFAYRTSKQDSSKYTPFYLMYGRQATLPIDIKMDPEKAGSTEVNMTDEEIQEKATQMIELRKRALQNVNKAKERNKQMPDTILSHLTS